MERADMERADMERAHMEKGITTAAAKLRGISTGRKRAAFAATVAAAVATMAGLAVPAGASQLAARPAAVRGAEHFQAMTTSATATTQGVIAWGAFTAAGVDHESSSNAPTSTDLFTFPGGSFKVTHTTKSMTQNVNAKTCFASFGGKGTFKLSGGTGKYKGISGSGTFTFSDIGVAPRTKSGACNLNANPIANQQVINANGSAKLP
jgi:hypothetical protein